MKIKASRVLEDALLLIVSGKQQYACAAIQDVETSVRFDLGEEVSSSAMQIFSKFMPAKIDQRIKLYSAWWDKGDVARIDALKKTIEVAKKRGD